MHNLSVERDCAKARSPSLLRYADGLRRCMAFVLCGWCSLARRLVAMPSLAQTLMYWWCCKGRCLREWRSPEPATSSPRVRALSRTAWCSRAHLWRQIVSSVNRAPCSWISGAKASRCAARSSSVAGLSRLGYTPGMKTAISVPDDVFADAERLARVLKKSRSQLYSRALREYVARHAADQVTEALDRVCKAGPPADDEFAQAAAKRTLRRLQW